MPTALLKSTTLGSNRLVNHNSCFMYMRSIRLALIIVVWSTSGWAQRGGGVKWAKDGKGYYAVESNSLVRYDLPSFQRVVIADAAQLTPGGKDQPIAVQGFSCSDDEKKW